MATDPATPDRGPPPSISGSTTLAETNVPLEEVGPLPRERQWGTVP